MNHVHRRTRHATRIILTVTCAASIAGCSSINGNADPIISVGDNLKLLRPYSIESSLIAYASPNDLARHSMSRLEYRNFVVALYLNAIDSQYAWFRTKLSRQRRGGNILFDFASLGLTGATTFAAKEAANRLGALATGLTGARGSIDKQLYFEQTLPALLAGMDTERAKVRTQIVNNLKRSANDYPLALAFTDISAYETSATLDRAIEQITAKASEDRRVAMVQLANAIVTCDSDEDLGTPRARITKALIALTQQPNGVAQLTKIAKRTNSSAVDASGQPLDATAISNNIRASLLKDYCSVSALNTLIAGINTDVDSPIL